MGSELLVRSYNVGCGDCIYVRIPGGNKGFHALIDCGSKEGSNTGVMERAIKHLETKMLPSAAGGKKRLDLIVLTHRHEDHIKGFDPAFFKNIAIKNIWLTAAMNKRHSQAKGVRALNAFATREMQGLAESGAALSPELEDLVALYGIQNPGATKALTETLPAANNIKAKYVCAGQTSQTLGISHPDTTIHVLGPEKNIDFYYLGDKTAEGFAGMRAGQAHFRGLSDTVTQAPPTNIAEGDFELLQSRVLSNALGFAVDDSEIQNNVSTVLLIEWAPQGRLRRLLFVGDAEWKKSYKAGRKNASWNVMWNQQKAKLAAPVDFLKVGHHGSHNATPWHRKGGPTHPVNQIFDAILPPPAAGKKPTAQCVVSTKRKQYDTIPDAALLAEIGKRVKNTKSYLTKFQQDPDFDADRDIFNYSKMKRYSKAPKLREVGEKGWLDKPQPVRTDMESAGKGSEEMLRRVEYVDVKIKP